MIENTSCAHWPECDTDCDFSQDALRAHLEYRQHAVERAEFLARICLAENLFDETFLPASHSAVGTYRERNHDFWKGAALELTSLGDTGLKSLGNLEFELNAYLGCGDYETRQVTLPASALSSNLQTFLSERRARRDGHYDQLESDHQRREQSKRNDELAKKRALLEKLKKELGEL